MALEGFDWDASCGAITQGGVRYVLMRPDVIMGIAAGANPRAIIDSMSASAFRNAQDSFERYRAAGLFEDQDPILQTCEMASKLGWGRWRIATDDADHSIVEVVNSPFTVGLRGSAIPVCGWICGILQAAAKIAGAVTAHVTEVQCVAQGHQHCKFQIEP